MGACQAGGTVIDWVMRAEGVPFRHAVESPAERLSAFSRLCSPALPSAAPRKALHLVKKAAGDGAGAGRLDAKLLAQVIGY